MQLLTGEKWLPDCLQPQPLCQEKVDVLAAELQTLLPGDHMAQRAFYLRQIDSDV